MGEYQHTLDGKGRLILPAKIREGLGETFIATRGLDDCLFIYTREEWAALEGKLKQLSLVKPEARAFSRYIFSGAAELEADTLEGADHFEAAGLVELDRGDVLRIADNGHHLAAAGG